MQSPDIKGGKMQFLLTLVFLILFIISFGLVIKRVYVDRNFLLVSEVVCDPEVEVCFARVCAEECDEEGVVDYYKIRTVSASEVSLCDPHDGDCPEVQCAELVTCSEELCNQENVPEGEECSDIPIDEVVEPTAEHGSEEELNALEIGGARDEE